jgi:hypothetical protein
MMAHFLVALAQLPWELVVPLTAGLAASGMALVLSHFLRGGATRDETAKAKPEEKQTPAFDPFVQGSASEQRSAYRRAGNSIEVLIGDPEQEKQATHGWIVDRSMGGLCLAVAEARAKGTVLKVRTVNAPPATPWVDLEVKSCRQTKEDWELGCQYVKTPPWAVMLLFG